MNETTDDDDDEKTCLSKIRQILTETKVEPAKSRTILELFRRFFSTQHHEEKLADADCDQGSYHEIVPRLYLGDYRLAMDPIKLKKLGFTHILNAAEGRKFGQINTSATYYEEVGVHYLGFSILDNPMYQIGQHFEEAIRFLDEALKEKKNKVYVHCQQGISRSATFVVAYLLHAYEDMSIFDAFQLVATRRRVWPNDGFCRHLLRLDKEKRKNKQSSQSQDNQAIESQLEQCAINNDNPDEN